VVSLGAHARGKELAIEVRDEGVGIDPERLPDLFERFSRADEPRTRQAGGTGLGLSIVKAIALAHGGAVEVDSSLGKGTTFRLVIPGIGEEAQVQVFPAPVSG